MLRTIISEERIRKRIDELGRIISADYKDKDLVAICVLKGASVFFADLVRCINGNVTMDFLSASRFGAGTQASGNINILKDIFTDIRGKDVLIVEDITATGYTLMNLKDILLERGANSVATAVFLDKPSGRATDFVPDYRCFEIPESFVVGYGLDYKDKYRNLPYVAQLSEDCRN